MAFQMTPKEEWYLVSTFLRDPDEYYRMVDIIIANVISGVIDTDRKKTLDYIKQQYSDTINLIKQNNPRLPGKKYLDNPPTAGIFNK